MSTAEEVLKEQIEELKKTNEALAKEVADLKGTVAARDGEINSVHVILDGAYVNLPDNFEDLKPEEQQRVSMCASRVQQFIMGLTGCPHRIRHVL